MALSTRRQFLKQTALAAATAYASSSQVLAKSARLFDLDAQSAPVDPNAVRALAAKIAGHVITPDSSDYNSARLVFNRAFDEHPAIIVRCADVSDIARALEFSRGRSLPLAVRGGGHSRAGFGTCDGGVVIDLGGMNRVDVDREKRTARIQPGTLVRNMDQATKPTGLATTSGGCPMVGLAGFTLGGGEGLLMSMFGAGCDNLLSARVMTVDGKELEASPKSNTDLFWAIRGGGGNFGIATAFEYRLHPIGQVLAGDLTYSAAGRIPELLHSFAAFVATAPDEMIPLGELLTSDKGPIFINHLCYVGDADRGNQLLKPLRALKPYDEKLETMSYWERQAGGFVPPPAAHFQTNLFLPQLDERTIAIITAAIPDAPPLARVLMVPFYGAITRVPLAETAFPLRQTGHELDIQCRWSTPEEKAHAVQWVTALRDNLQPFSHGLYVNQTTERTAGLAKEAYGSNYARLAKIKKKYDPDNVLRLNQNIVPS